jgi:hypothetical protein
MSISLKLLLLAWLMIAATFRAQALTITPDNSLSLLTFTTHNQSAIDSEISASYPDLTLAYKMNHGGGEEGPLLGSYQTSFSNTPADPSDATITYISGPGITAPEMYLLVKDGNQSPYAYFFDISEWNWMEEDLVLTEFWPQRGAISNVTIYTMGTAQVPDGGATLMLMGISFSGLIITRRLIRAAQT